MGVVGEILGIKTPDPPMPDPLPPPPDPDLGRINQGVNRLAIRRARRRAQQTSIQDLRIEPAIRGDTNTGISVPR